MQQFGSGPHGGKYGPHDAAIAIDDGLEPLPNVVTSAEAKMSDWVAGPGPKIDIHKDQRLPRHRYPDD